MRFRATLPKAAVRLLSFLLAAPSLLLLFSQLADAQEVCVAPPSGAIAWWSFDETSGTTTNDTVGGHIGVQVNGPQPGAGIVAGSLRFDGADDYVTVPDSDAWAFGARDFTIELWANFSSLASGSVYTAVFVGNDEGPSTQNKWFFTLAAGALHFHINGPTVGSKSFPWVPFSPAIGQWYHLAVTRNASTYTIYINGNPAGSATNTDVIPNPNAPLTIGQAEGLGFMPGLLDELTIYNRALAQSEIQTIVTAGHAGKCKSAASDEDLNFDGKPDILWRNSVTGENYVWFMHDAARLGGAWLARVQDLNWKIVGVDFFNNDGRVDILWRNSATGENYIWFMNGTTRVSGAWLQKVEDLNWKVVGVAYVNNDDKPDILWRNSSTGENYIWFMNGTSRVSGAWIQKVEDLSWAIVGFADFNADTKPDILWRNSSTGQNYVWFMNGVSRIGGAWLATAADLNWKIVTSRDYNSDTKPDILWRNSSTGENYVWYMDGVTRTGGAWILGVADLNWSIAP